MEAAPSPEPLSLQMFVMNGAYPGPKKRFSPVDAVVYHAAIKCCAEPHDAGVPQIHPAEGRVVRPVEVPKDEVAVGQVPKVYRQIVAKEPRRPRGQFEDIEEGEVDRELDEVTEGTR